MEILQLRYFIDAATSQNFSETARRYMVPPSSVSQSIKRLEEELGVPLFVRTANKATLSPAGKRFFEEVKQALMRLDKAKEAAQQSFAEEPIRVHLHMHRRLVTNVIKDFRALHPEVTFVTTYGAMKSSVDQDVIVSYLDRDWANVNKAEIAWEEFALAYSKNHFTFGETITAQDIQNCPFATMGRDNHSIYGFTRQFCARLDVEPHIVLKSEDPYYVRQCIELGQVIAVVPTLSWQGQFADNVALRPLDLWRTTYLYTNRNGHPLLPELCRLLTQALQKDSK